MHKPKLSLEVKVERGGSPDAGFEEAASRNDGNAPAQDSLTISPDGANVFDQFTSAMGISLSGAETLGLLCSRVRMLVPADSIAVYLVEARTLVPKCVLGENFKLLTSLRIPLGEGVAGWVAENHQPIMNGNPLVEPGYSSGLAVSATLNSVLAIPLQTSSGAIAVLALYRTEKDGFSRSNMQDLLTVSDKLARAVESALHQEHRTMVQNSTGALVLPNARALFSTIAAEVNRRRDSNATLTVLLCGLEGLYDIHESIGSVAAQETLEHITRGFRQNCRDVDYLAWRGGDDFVFLLPELPQEAVDALVATLTSLVSKAGLELWNADLLSLSAGAVTFPLHGDTPETLLAEAENRMLTARKSKLRSGDNRTSDDLASLTEVSNRIAVHGRDFTRQV